MMTTNDMKRTNRKNISDESSEPALYTYTEALEYQYRSTRRIREEVEETEWCDKNFKIRSDAELDALVSKILVDIEDKKEKKKILARERKFESKMRDLARRKVVAELEEIICEDFDKKRTRSVKSLEYDMSRHQLHAMKMKQRELKRLRKHKNRIERGVLLVGSKLQMELNLDYSDIVSAVLKGVGKNILSNLTSFGLKHINSILMCIFSLVSDCAIYEKIMSIVNVLYMFDINVVGEFGNKLVSWAWSVFPKIVSGVRFQSFSIESIQSVLDKVLHSELVQAIRTVFVGITTYLSFPPAWTAAVFAIIGSGAYKMSVLRLIENVLKTISKVTSAASLWWNGRNGEAVPLSEILFGATMLDSLRESYQTLSIYKDHTYSGLPVKGYMCQFYYMRLSSTFLSTAEKYLEQIGRHNPNYTLIRSWTVDVTCWTNAVSDGIMALNRVPAFAVALIGDPGVGKSYTTKLLLSRPATIKGYKFEESQIYTRNSAEEFWEGYKNKQHNVVFFSEVARTNLAITKMKGDPGLDSLLSAIDSNKYNVPMAFGEKGKVPFLAEYLLLDSNTESLGLNEAYENPAAFARRLLYIQQIVRKEFRAEGGNNVDFDKAKNLDNPFDAYLFLVYKKVPIDGKKFTIVKLSPDFVDYKKMLEIHDWHFAKHQMSNSKMNSRVLDIVRKIPSMVNMSYDTINDGISLGTSDNVQNRFLPPESDEMKEQTRGVVGQKIPPRSKTGKEVFCENVEECREKILGYAKDMRESIGNVSKIPSLFCNNALSFCPEIVSDKITKLLTSGVVNQRNPRDRILSTFTDREEYDALAHLFYKLDEPSTLSAKQLPPERYDQFGDFLYEEEEGKMDLPEVLRRFIYEVKVFYRNRNLYEGRVLSTELKDLIRISVKLCSESIEIMECSALEGLSTLFSDDDLEQQMDDEFSLISSEYYADQSSLDESKDTDIESDSESLESFGYNWVRYHRDPLEWDWNWEDSDFSPWNLSDTFLQSDNSRDSGPTVLAHIHAMYDFSLEFIMLVFIKLIVYLASYKPGYFEFLIFAYFLMYHRYLALLCLLLIPIRYVVRVLILRYMSNWTVSFLKKRLEASKMMLYDVGNSFLSSMSLCKRQVYACPPYLLAFAGSAMTAIVMVGYVLKAYKEVKSTADPQLSIEEVEVSTGASYAEKRVKTKAVPEHWNKLSPISHSYPFTQTLEDFTSLIMSNMVQVWYKPKGTEHVVSQFGFGIKSRFLIVNTHFLDASVVDCATVFYSDKIGDREESGQLSTIHRVDLGNDVSIVATTRNFKDLTKHLSNGVISSGLGAIQGNSVAFNFMSDDLHVQNIVFKGLYSYFGFSRKGLCGNILLARVGKSCTIIGMHVSGRTDERRTGFSTPLTRSIILSGISKLESAFSFKESSFPEAGMLQFSDVSVNRKSPFSHIPIPTVTYYGTVGKALVKRKSRIEKSIYKVDIPDVERLTGRLNMTKFGAPHMAPFCRGSEYISPQNNALLNFVQPMFIGREEVSERTCAMLKKRLLERVLSEKGKILLRPYTMMEAINGSLLDDFFNRVNMSTSAGWPLKGKKCDYLILGDDGKTATPVQEVVDAITTMVETYLSNERCLPVFNVALKDEVLKLSKIEAGITRLFYVNPLAFLILLRMYLGPIVTLIQELDAFYSMVGINMYSEAHRVYSVIYTHPYYMESDFKKFDITAACEIRRKTFEIVVHILKSLGYNDDAIKVVNGLLTDSLFPMYILDGDLFSKSSVPSGYYGTAELNCLILLYFLAMLFVEGQMKHEIPEDADFFDHVKAMLYGDDSGASVSEIAKVSVNNLRLAALAKSYGMTVTSSDKDSELEEFVPADKATFLKRTLYWYRGFCYAPLDHESIYKMTSYSLEPTCTRMERDESLIRSVMTEWYLHIWSIVQNIDDGQKLFDDLKRVYDSRFISEYGRAVRTSFDIRHISECVGDGLFPLEIVVSEEDNTHCSITHEDVLNSQLQYGRVAMAETLRAHASLETCHENLISDVWTNVRHTHRSSIESYYLRRSELKDRIEILEKELDDSGFLSIPNPNSIRLTVRYQTDLDYREQAEAWIERMSLLESAQIELGILNAAIWKFDDTKVEFQMDTGAQESGAIEEKVVVEHENLTEISGDVADRSSVDEYVHVKMIKADEDLNDFFARPINISTASLPIGTGNNFFVTMDPLSLYLSDPAVRAKIRNFAYIKCKTVVRISVSGTPFDYGNMIATALPWIATSDIWSKELLGGSANLGGVVANGNFRNVAATQTKLAHVINVRENKPLEIEMPWISPMPIGRLFTNSTGVIASGTKFPDMDGMWTLYVSILNTLRSVTASPSPLYMQIYAYLKDVEIGVPTGTQLAVTTQMADEREKGPVERVASNIAGISEKLEDAPYIGLYARASTFVLRGLAGVASLFGWSAPVLITQPKRVKNEPYQNGANYIQHDTGQRLTWDPKQELPISTEFAGVQEDELVIKDMCKRRTLVYYSQWSAAQNPYATFLQLAVHPRLSYYYKGTAASAKNVFPTPAAWISQLFSRWHGRMVFTFEAVTSAFHRGKLIITYDPNVMQSVLISSNTNLNKQQTHIWDIQETQRYSICIEWNHPRYWADNLSEGDSTNALAGPALNPIASWYNAVNGFLSIAPLTKLQSPDNSNVEINVYVHFEDMEFNRASTNFMAYSHQLDFQSSDTRSEKNNSNIEESCISINKPLAIEGIRPHHYGEQIVSLRSMMKRFTDEYTPTTTPGAANSYYFCEFLNYPQGTGFPGQPTTIVPNINMLDFLRYSFLGMRGSIRRRIQCEVDTQLNFSPAYVYMGKDTDTYSAASGSIAPGATNYPINMLDGATTHMLETNAGIEIEIPFYSSDLFIPSGTYGLYTVPPGSTAWNMSIPKKVTAVFRPSGTPTVVRFRTQFATGEDFQLFWFMNTLPFLSS